jgi:Flp pilus assembly protein TadB
MTRVLVLAVPALWLGVTLLLSSLPWAQRRTHLDRLRPHLPVAVEGATRSFSTFGSLREITGPLAQAVGARLSRLLGVDEDLSVRLRRVHSEVDPVDHRVRQLGITAAALGVGAALAAALRPAPPVVLLLLLGTPMMAFLVIEQRTSAASARWQRHLRLELPVVTEQLGMLLSAGYSLGAALTRLAERGSGAATADLRRVCDRISQGVPEIDALREWAALARVDALDQLVAVLALNREATDLGGLVAEEARAVRRELHRNLLEVIERRSQQVWIPVTVATLVPGVIFLAVPFVHAMRAFSGS